MTPSSLYSASAPESPASAQLALPEIFGIVINGEHLGFLIWPKSHPSNIILDILEANYLHYKKIIPFFVNYKYANPPPKRTNLA